jgi:hypothetical protein
VRIIDLWSDKFSKLPRLFIEKMASIPLRNSATVHFSLNNKAPMLKYQPQTFKINLK